MIAQRFLLDSVLCYCSFLQGEITYGYASSLLYNALRRSSI